MKKLCISIMAAGVVLVFAQAGYAHHSVATFFLQDETVEVTGVLQSYRLVNPHMKMEVEVTTESGEKQLWILTGGVTGDLRAAGWTPTSVKPGEVVTVSGYPARNPDAHGMYVRRMVAPDGTVFELARGRVR